MKKYEYLEIDYTAKGVVFLCTDKHKEVINSYAENGYRYKVISKEELLEKLWNDKYYLDENVLLVNMTRLKKKMKEIGIVHLLENIRGKGWKL